MKITMFRLSLALSEEKYRFSYMSFRGLRTGIPQCDFPLSQHDACEDPNFRVLNGLFAKISILPLVPRWFS